MPIKRPSGFPWLKTLVMLILAGILSVTGFIGTVYFGLWGALPSHQELTGLEHSLGSEVVDRNGLPLGRYFILDRRSIEYDQLPDHLIQALVSTEDARFFDHSGIDYRSLVRVLIKTIILQDRSGSGGSTITQQLAKNLFPREDYSKIGLAVAKIREAIVASRIEDIYDKPQILALYLNTVSFSDNTYGIESAAKRFFSKSVSDLNLIESATLVGTLKANTTYNPRSRPEQCRSRRNVVLSQMEKYGNLESAEADKAKSGDLTLKLSPKSPSEGVAPYFLFEVKKELSAWIKANPKEDGTLYNLYSDGLKITTTLDRTMQVKAEAAMQKHLSNLQNAFEVEWGTEAPWRKGSDLLDDVIIKSPSYKKLERAGMEHWQVMDSLAKKSPMSWFTWQGDKEVFASVIDSIQHHIKMLNTGFLAVDPDDGAVRTWIGGIDHARFPYDHVSRAKRQVGSTFKPIVYATAIEQGVSPCEYFSVREVSYANLDGWTPSNGDTDLEGQNLSMQAALSRSINTVAIKVMEKAGVENVVQQARKLNIQSHLPKVPSLALGTADLSVIEMAGAYAAFVNSGHHPVEPYLINTIEDSEGNIIFQHQETDLETALSNQTAQIMIEMMKSVVNTGTGQRLRWKYQLDNDIAGKTGTTQSNRDGWFIGLTPNLVTVTWVGADDPRVHFKTTKTGQGANSALPIFGEFYRSLKADASFDQITSARFSPPTAKTLAQLDCEPMKKDGLIKRIFTDSDEPVVKDFDDEEKQEGIFKKIKGLFKKK